MRLTIEIVMRIGATPGSSDCARSKSHTEACRVRSRRTLADAKESGVGSIAKMTVEEKQPTVVMQQEPSSSPFSSPTAMQDSTQNIQNELMDSQTEMGAQEHKEQKKVRLNETLSSEMSKRPVVKAKSAHPSMIAPMMGRLGSTVFLESAPSSKDETAVCTRLTEWTLWQLLRMCDSSRWRKRQDGEQESVAIVIRQDPSVSKTINVHQAKTGEKLDSEESGTGKPKRCKSSMSSKSKRKLPSRRFEWHQGRKYGQDGWKHERIQTSFGESSGLRHGDDSIQSKSRTMCTKRCGWSTGYSEPHQRQRSFQRVRWHSSSARNKRFGVCSKIVAVFVTRVKCMQHTWRVSTNTVFWKTHWCGWKETLNTCNNHWRDGFIPAISGVRANDLEQLTRETLRVNVCERVDPRFLTTLEILHRKMAWNAEDFFWICDPIHTLALADEFGFVRKKQLDQMKSILVAPGPKTINKSLHDGADVLDERRTLWRKFLIGTALNDGQDRPETQHTTVESARFMFDPTRAVKCTCVSITTKHPCTAGAFHIKKCSARSEWWQGHIEKVNRSDRQWWTLGFILEVICWRRVRRHIRLWRCPPRRVSTSRPKMLLMLWRSAMFWRSATWRWWRLERTWQLGVQRPRDVELAACITWRRRGSLMSAFEPASRSGEHNETKKMDSTLLLKGTSLRPPLSSSSWSLRMVAASFPEVEAARDCRMLMWNVRNVCETNDWFWICVGMIIVILTELSGVPSGISISDDCSQQKETA